MELILLIIVLSPIIAIISIIVNFANGKTINDLRNENNEIRAVLDLYKKRFGELDEKTILDLKQSQNIVTENSVSSYDKPNEIIDDVKEDIVESDSDLSSDSVQYPSLADSVKEYIDKNNISQGNLLFALGVLFISIAGIVFATTTWMTIPNLLKIGIIFVSSLVTLFLSQFAKKKFKLNKTSITLYVLFCILISLIPLSMGYFKLFGNYLTIGGNGEFLLYAISLLVFIVSFGIGTIYYELNKIASYMMYVINIELVLIILNFTKQYDIVLMVVSIYNFILLLLTKYIKTRINYGVLSIFTKDLKVVSNNTLLILSLFTVLNASSGFLITIISLVFAMSFALNLITIELENKDIVKYIIATIFIIISCYRLNSIYEYKYVTEYFAVMTFMLTIILSCFKRFKDSESVLMVYGLIIASILSVGNELATKAVTLSLIISMLVNLTAIITIMICTNNKYLKYLKTAYYIVFALAITKYIYQILAVTQFKIITLSIMFLLMGLIVSNIINKLILKNKFTDEKINLIYVILINFGIVILANELQISYSFNRTLVYNILTALSLIIVLLSEKSKNFKFKNKISTTQQIVLFFTNCIIIKSSPISNVLVLAAMVYDYIFNEKEYSKYLLQILYFIYINLLGLFVFTDNKTIILSFLVVLCYAILNIINYKKIKKVDLRFIDILTMLNLVEIFRERLFRYDTNNMYFARYSQLLIVIVLINVILLYMYCVRDNKYKRVIEWVLPISLFMLVVTCYGFIYLICNAEGSTIGLYRTINVFVAYYVGLMICSIVRLFAKKVSNITKRFAPFAIAFCLFNFLDKVDFLDALRWLYLNYKFFNEDIYILTCFLTVYLIALTVKLKMSNETYKSKYIGLLIKWQIVLVELLFIDKISEVEFKITNILFYFIIANFALMMIYRLIVGRCVAITKASSNDNVYTFNSLAYRVKSSYSFIVNLVVNVLGTIAIILILIIDVYRPRFLHLSISNSYNIVLKYIALAFVINISMWKRKQYKIRHVLIYLIPYVAVNCLVKDAVTKNYLILAVFAVYYVLALVLKNIITRLKIYDADISYFAISNILFVLSLDKVLVTVLSGIYINHPTIILLVFAALFVLQFKTEDKLFNKILYTISLSFFSLALLMQDFITFRNFKLEYYILIILLAVFVIDRIIWKLDKNASSKVVIVSELVTYSLVLIKIMTTALIINTIVFGVVLFIALIISYIIKNYYSFVVTASFMIVTAIYLTRELWFSIAWWAYLLIAGVLLILFATKNEQLKKQNKTFMIAIKELNEKWKRVFTKS